MWWSARPRTKGGYGLSERTGRRDSPEERLVLQVAEEYRERGYEVVLQPKPSSLPEFLGGYRPDLLARRGGESVVVEVKAGSVPPRQRDRFRDLARAVDGQPGWRFELVIRNLPPVPEPEAPAGGRPSLTGPDAARAVADAEELVGSGRPEAALLWAWSAAEATLRLLASAEGISPRRSDAAYLLKELALEGTISREDYDVLRRSLEARNAVAHGFRPEEGAQLDPLVRELLQTAAHLIHLLPDTQPA